jgi:hypothetical protein
MVLISAQVWATNTLKYTFSNQTCVDSNSHVFFVMITYVLNPLAKKHEEGLLHEFLTLFLGKYHSDCAILFRII